MSFRIFSTESRLNESSLSLVSTLSSGKVSPDPSCLVEYSIFFVAAEERCALARSATCLFASAFLSRASKSTPWMEARSTFCWTSRELVLGLLKLSCSIHFLQSSLAGRRKLVEKPQDAQTPMPKNALRQLFGIWRCPRFVGWAPALALISLWSQNMGIKRLVS
jgi:hypothetical protein